MPHQSCLRSHYNAAYQSSLRFSVTTGMTRRQQQFCVHFKTPNKQVETTEAAPPNNTKNSRISLEIKHAEQTADLQQEHLKAPCQTVTKSGPLMIYAAHGWTHTNKRPVLHDSEALEPEQHGHISVERTVNLHTKLCLQGEKNLLQMTLGKHQGWVKIDQSVLKIQFVRFLVNE